MWRTQALVSKGWCIGRAFPFLCKEGGWMKNEEEGIRLYLSYEASAHNQSLVERVPAGRVFSWCKLSIRSQEQMHKEACVKDWIPTQRTTEGGSRRDLSGIYSHFPLYLQLSTCHFSCCPSDDYCWSWFLRFPPFTAVTAHEVSTWGGFRRGDPWENGATFHSTALSSFCLAGLFLQAVEGNYRFDFLNELHPQPLILFFFF